MNTKTIRVADATNLQLDWLAAKAAGAEGAILAHLFHFRPDFHPTTDLSIMNCLIDRKKIGLARGNDILFVDGGREPLWIASHPSLAAIHPNGVHAPTAPLAVTRCYVISELGETVEVPEELV